MSKDSVTLALEIFLLDCRARNLADETLVFYDIRVKHFFDYSRMAEALDLSEISTSLLRRYFVDLQELGWKSNSVHAAARALKAFFNFCADEGLLDVSPMRRIRLPKIDNEIKPAFSKNELESLLAVADVRRDRAIVLCLLDKGCRAKESIAWNAEDGNTMNGTVQQCHTKNQKGRMVYLGNRSRKELLKLCM